MTDDSATSAVDPTSARRGEGGQREAGLVRFDNNKYSVSASAVGRPVDVGAYADRIVIRKDGRIVAEHKRSRFGAHPGSRLSAR